MTCTCLATVHRTAPYVPYTTYTIYKVYQRVVLTGTLYLKYNILVRVVDEDRFLTVLRLTSPYGTVALGKVPYGSLRPY